ncbi:MAG: beta-propeller fold lactonase family protein, partial [Patescibacteria group bacterium]|nr:beta-propeller fold lactonase family protein [Patescibacteria group bacterium]
TSTFVFAVSSSYAEISNRLTVGGKSVCLQDGTNCSAGSGSPIGAYIWTDSPTNNTIYPTTSTRDVLLGGSTTNTAAFIFDQNTNTSTVIIGNQTGNANLLVGTTTYGGGLNSNFTLNGNDVLIQGQLGSIEGLFSATGVSVGTGTTVYGDGNLYKTTSGDFTLALNNTASNWRFRSGGQESFTVASTGNVGIGVSTPLEALDVSGTIRNVYQSAGQGLDIVGTGVLTPGQSPEFITVSGRYAYTANPLPGNDINIVDISNPELPVVVGTSTLTATAGPRAIAISGNYAYTANKTNGTVNVIDISNPTSPIIVATTTLTTIGSAGTSGIAISGSHAYITNYSYNSINVLDISNPLSPIVIASTTVGIRPDSIYLQGTYAYVVNTGSDSLSVVNIADPNNPTIIGTKTFAATSNPYRVFVSGRYAYTINQGDSTLSVIDVSNPALPIGVGTSTLGTGTGASSLFVNGRYAYVTNGDIDTISVVDVSIPTSPTIVATGNLPSGAYTQSLYVSGRYAYTANADIDTISVIDLKGTETSALLAHSAELGSLQVLTNGTIYNQLTVGGGLTVGPGGILSQGSLAISSTNTTSTFVFAVSSSYAEISNRLTVGGKSVCLADGTNCQSSSSNVPNSAYIWTDSPTNNTIYPTTSTRDVLLGGSTTNTAAFIFDQNTNTSTVIIGNQTGNANLLVGTTTYGGGLNSNFTLNGNDVLIQGQLGSIEGLFSATGVSVGTGTTVYGDGNLYKTTSGDFNLALNNTASNWRFRSGGQESFTVASTGNVGIGVSTPLEALDVSGTIRNVYNSSQGFSVVTSTFLNVRQQAVFVAGRYAYTANDVDGSISIVDVSNPSSPYNVTTSYLGSSSIDPSDIYVAGKYAYTANGSSAKSVSIIDVSNPASPFVVTTTYTGANSDPYSLYGNGNLIYFTNNTFSNSVGVLDVSNPTNPLLINTLDLGTAEPYGIHIQGRYAYTANWADDTVSIIDLNIPTAPVLVTSTYIGLNTYPTTVYAQGRYVYVGNNGNNTVSVLDVSSPANPSVVGTVNLAAGATPNDIFVSGRYAITADLGNNSTISIIDVASSTNPILISSVYMGSASIYPSGVFISGRYAYVASSQAKYLSIVDLKGTETSALLAHSAELGSLSVLTNASIFNQLTVGGGLMVGAGGILSQGSLAISSTNTTSTFVYAVSTTNMEVSSRLTVGGVGVCLSNGTGCTSNIPAGAYIWTDNATNNTIYPTTTTKDILLGGSTTDTAAFIFDKGTTISSVIIGNQTGNANLLVGTTTYGGGLNSDFVLDGNDVLVQGMLGSIDGLFSATGVKVGTGTTVYGDGDLYKTTAGDFNLSLSNAASNWRFRIAGRETFTVASSGFVGIGVSTPLEALDVSGTIRNILRTGQDFVITTSTQTLATPKQVAVSGRYAYVTEAGATDKLEVFDVTNVASPTSMGSVAVGDEPNAVFIRNEYAYVANQGDNSVSIVNISSPATPSVVGTYYLGGSPPNSLYVSGKFMYLGWGSLLDIVNIEAPSAPYSVTSVNFGAVVNAVEVQGGYAYVATNNDNFHVVDISNSFAPSIESSFALAYNDPRDIAVQGRYAYVSGNSNGFSIIDISNPASPSEVAATAGSQFSYSLSVSGRYLYLRSNSNGNVYIYDVSVPASPTLINSKAVSSVAGEGLALSGRYLYTTAETANKLIIMDVGGIETSSLTAGSAELGELQVLTNGVIQNQLSVGGGLNVGLGGIFSAGSLSVGSQDTTSTFLYAVSATQGMFSKRLTVGGNLVINGDTTNPALDVRGNIQNVLQSGQTFSSVAVTTTAYDLTDVIVKGRYAYMLSESSSTFVVLDVSDAATPSVVGTLTLPAIAKSLAVSGDRAYVGSNSADRKVYVVDLSIPSSPSILGSVLAANAGNIGTLDVAGQYVYFTSDSDADGIFGKIDVSNPASPVVIATTTCTGSGPKTISVKGKYVYVSAASANEFRIYNVVSRNNITLAGTAAVGDGAYGFSMSGRYAYVSNLNSDDISIVDVAYPGNPTVVATTTGLTGPGNSKISGRYLYVTNYLGSTISIFDLIDPTSPVLISSPTITNGPIGIDVSGRYAYIVSQTAKSLTILDIKGMEVNGLMAASVEAGTLQVLTDMTVGQQFDVYGALSVGAGGIFSQGSLAVGGTSTFADVKPAANNTYDLGTSSYSWRNVYSSGTTYAADLTISNTLTQTVQNGASLDIVTSTYLGDNRAPRGVVVSGKLMFTANSTDHSLGIYDVSAPSSPRLLQEVDVAQGLYSVAISGNYAFTANYTSHTMSVVDISSPAQSYVAATLSLGASYSPDRISVVGPYAYLQGGSYFIVVDISTPTSPRVLSITTLASQSESFAIQGKYAYFAGWSSNKMHIYDISNPASLVLASSTYFGTSKFVSAVAVQGSYAYVGCDGDSMVRVVDISNNSAPVILGSVLIPSSFDFPDMEVSGRYLYTTDGGNTNNLYVVDVSSSTNPILLVSQYLGTNGAYATDLEVAGRYAYVSSYLNDRIYILDIMGAEVNGLIAHSAEMGSLQVLDSANIVNQLVVGGGLSVGAGGIYSLGSLAVASTNTTSTFAYAVSSTNGVFSNNLTVGGSSVCLSNGTNCPTLEYTVVNAWVDNATYNTVYFNTSTRDLLLGGSTTATAGLVFDQGNTVSSLIVGNGALANTHLFVGTSTYGGGLNSNFSMSGNDVLVQGMVGSIEGMFSATGVTVGTGSMVYGDGYMYKTNAGDFTLSLNDAASNWRFRTNATERLTVASTGNIGIGVTTPLEALDVKGNIKNVLRSGSTFSTVFTTSTGLNPWAVSIVGQRMYVNSADNNQVRIFDILDKSNPTLIKVLNLASAKGIAAAGDMLYVGGVNAINVIDVSNAGNPVVLSTTTMGSGAKRLTINGRYLYAVDEDEQRIYVVDVNDPYNPIVVSEIDPGNAAYSAEVVGDYLYVPVAGSVNALKVYDISNPYAPILVASQGLGSFAFDIAIQGRYAYVSNFSSNNISILDVSDPTSLRVLATTTHSGAAGLALNGRYLYVTNFGSNTLTIYDVSSSTNPVSMGTATVGSGPIKVEVSGRYAFVTAQTSNNLSIVDVKGVETNGLIAASLEAGSLQVNGNGTVAGDFSIGNALTVGKRGIFTNGTLGVYGTSTFGTDAVVSGSMVIGTTSTNIGERLQVEGNTLIRRRSMADVEAWSSTGTSYTNAPSIRYEQATVWTGDKMIVWGGRADLVLGTGAVYDPRSDTWKTMSTTNAPSARWYHSAVWTGSKMIVWGGQNILNVYVNTGAIYDPQTDSWKSVTTTGALSGRGRHSAVWTGSKMLIWGGGDAGSPFNDGALYDPVTDTWTTISTTNAPQARAGATGIWTGSKILVWGGGNPTVTSTGGLYDPALNTWQSTTLTNAPAGRTYHSAVWTGSKMIVWGGSDAINPISTGGIYDPVTNSWAAVTDTGAPVARMMHSSVWTGSKMIVWGGNNGAGTDYGTGSLYDPVNNSWTAMTTTNAPDERSRMSAVWTGLKMIIWGGVSSNYFNSGSTYTPTQYQGNLMV